MESDPCVGIYVQVHIFEYKRKVVLASFDGAGAFKLAPQLYKIHVLCCLHRGRDHCAVGKVVRVIHNGSSQSDTDATVLHLVGNRQGQDSVHTVALLVGDAHGLGELQVGLCGLGHFLDEGAACLEEA